MNFLYDLSKCPASWDFLNYLVNCEMTRRREGAESFSVTFALGPKDGFRDDKLPRPLSQRVAIFENVMKPALRLFNATIGNDPQGVVIPYIPRPIVEACNAGEKVPLYWIPDESREEARAWLNGRKPIVITLREASYYPERNSNVPAWIQFAKNCGEDVVFVRDTAKADEPIEGFDTCPRASKELLFRAALMQEAKCNLFVANGPCSLAFFGEAPWIMFRPLTPELPTYGPGQPEWWPKAFGIGVNEQLPWSAEKQKIYWFEDSLEHLERAWALFNGKADPHPPVIKMGQIKTKGVMTDDERFEHSKINVQVVKKRMQEIKPGHDGTAIICGYGPSLEDTWKFARAERNTIPNSTLVSVSGAHDYLVDRSVRPNFHVECDPRKHKGDMINKPQRKTTYLIASCCHPDVVQKLSSFDVELWHLFNGDESFRITNELEPHAFMIGGGGSVGLRAICVMYARGYRKFRVHGMDCSFRGNTHAGPHTGKVQQRISVRCGDREFITSPVLVAYAQQMTMMIKQFEEEVIIDIHGDGLLRQMCEVGMRKAA